MITAQTSLPTVAGLLLARESLARLSQGFGADSEVAFSG